MQTPRPLSKDALRVMIAILIAILLVALYANVQKLRRNQIEKASFSPAPAASVTPSP